MTETEADDVRIAGEVLGGIVITHCTGRAIYGKLDAAITRIWSLPAMRSFCAYCLIAILFTFIFECTFFVAWLSIDERRADDHRDALFFCVRLKKWKPNSCSQVLFIKSFFRDIWAKVITNVFVKVIVLIMTAGLLAFGIYGTINLKQETDWTAFIPGDSYASSFLRNADLYFPANTEGIPTSVFLIDVDYYSKFSKLEKLHADLEAAPYTESGTLRSWWFSYRQWLNASTDEQVINNTDTNRFPKTEDDFYDLLFNKYLLTQGAIFKNDIVRNATTNRIIASRNALRHHMLTSTLAEVTAMEDTRAIVANTGFNRENAFAYTRRYLVFEGNKAIQSELYRNLGLAFLCVAVMTLILIADIIVSFFICLCVIMTVVDLGGMMFFWGLTVDTVTSIILILSMGLSIDFAAHIGHMFMTTRWTRDERTRRTMVLMGPAVFSGGFSTFLAFLLLVFSKSLVFKTFFKVFLGVVIFGLFHGLVFLPVILSILGPKPYKSAHHDPQEDKTEDLGRRSWYDNRRRRSPAASSLQSAGQLQRQNLWGDRFAKPHNGSGGRNGPVHPGYIPRANAFFSKRPNEDKLQSIDRDRSLGSLGYIYGMQMPHGYVRPSTYRKPAAYVKPPLVKDDPWPPAIRRY